MTTLLRGVMKEKAGLEDAVKHSDLDWIVVRPAGRSNGDPKGIRIVKPETEERFASSHSPNRINTRTLVESVGSSLLSTFLERSLIVTAPGASTM